MAFSIICHEACLHCSLQAWVRQVLKQSLALDKGWSGPFIILLAWADATSQAHVDEQMIWKPTSDHKKMS